VLAVGIVGGELLLHAEQLVYRTGGSNTILDSGNLEVVVVQGELARKAHGAKAATTSVKSKGTFSGLLS